MRQGWIESCFSMGSLVFGAHMDMPEDGVEEEDDRFCGE